MIEPRVAQRPLARRPVAQAPVDQVAIARAMTRQAAVLHPSARQTAVREPAGAQPPTEHWYRREDPFTTAETDAAFAAFMAGDNPHLRTDEVPVVDFTSMIEKVGPDGRPVDRRSRSRSRIQLGLAAVATMAILAAASAFGFIEIPGIDGVGRDMFRSTVSASTADGAEGFSGETVDAQPTQPVESPEVPSSTPDGGAEPAGAGEQPLSITAGD